MKKSFLISILSLTTLIAGCGCGSKPSTETTTNIATETIIETETNAEADVVIESLPWLVLSELETVPELRAQFDEYFGITGETGNKVGPIYYNTDTEQADQNVTLFMVLKNTDTRNHFIDVDSRDAIANMAIEYYSMDIGDTAATYAAINAYFNLLPDEALKEGEEPAFDNGKISRAAAMALLMRATTQVSEGGTPAVNENFTSTVGSGQFTDFAAPRADARSAPPTASSVSPMHPGQSLRSWSTARLTTITSGPSPSLASTPRRQVTAAPTSG